MGLVQKAKAESAVQPNYKVYITKKPTIFSSFSLRETYLSGTVIGATKPEPSILIVILVKGRGSGLVKLILALIGLPIIPFSSSN